MDRLTGSMTAPITPISRLRALTHWPVAGPIFKPPAPLSPAKGDGKKAPMVGPAAGGGGKFFLFRRISPRPRGRRPRGGAHHLARRGAAALGGVAVRQ